MKLIIEIDKLDYQIVKENKEEFNNVIYEAIRNGVPLNDSLANRDVLKIIFPNWFDHIYE